MLKDIIEKIESILSYGRIRDIKRELRLEILPRLKKEAELQEESMKLLLSIYRIIKPRGVIEFKIRTLLIRCYNKKWEEIIKE